MIYRDARRLFHVVGIGLCLLAVGGAAQAADLSGYAGEVFRLLNQERAANGLPALRVDAALDQAAQAYSEAMKAATDGGDVFLSHTGPDGSSFSDRISRSGYQWTTIGENIAAGQKSPGEVVSAWMSSPGHRANILDPDFRDVGIGVAVGPGTWPGGNHDPEVIWWTTDFGAGRGSPPLPPPAPAPTVTGYTDAAGAPIASAGPGTPVIILGSNLGTQGRIRFGGTLSAAASAWSPSAISVIVPAAPSYPVPGAVVVETNGQTVRGPEFTITAPPAPAPPPTPTPPGPTPTPEPTPTPLPGPTPPSPPSTGAQPTPPTVPTAPAQPVAPAVPPSVVDVRAFGARGDGIADDSAAIQAAVDAARPGGTVQFPSGTYRLEVPIAVRTMNLVLQGEGAASVLRHSGHTALQFGRGEPLAGLLVTRLRFVGLPGRYRSDGNAAAAIEISGPKGSLIRDCDFEGSGFAVVAAGAPGATFGTRIVECRVRGWGSSALSLVGGERVEHCSLTQDDPDRAGGRSEHGLLIRPGAVDVQVSDTVITNVRGQAVLIDNQNSTRISGQIQLRGVQMKDCRAGVLVRQDWPGAPQARNVVIEACALTGVYDGAAIWVRQGDGIEIRGNSIDGAADGIALGLWPAGESGQSVRNLRAEGNTLRHCDHGLRAAASNGGSFLNVSVAGNTFSDCRVPVDLGGASGIHG